MEHRENQIQESRRLMRFSFEPNEALTNQFASQLANNEKEGRLHAPLRLYASRQLVMTLEDALRQENAFKLNKVSHKFTTFQQPIHMLPQLDAAEISPTTTRFRFLPVDQEGFEKLTSLRDPYTNTELFRNLAEQPANARQYIFADVATNALASKAARDQAKQRFLQEAATGRYFVHTNALSTIRDMHPPRQPAASLADVVTLDELRGDDDELPAAI